MRINIVDSNSNICIGNGAEAKQEFNNGGVAIGDLTQALGQNAIAIGSSNGISENSTTAEGNNAIAIGAGVKSISQNGLGEIRIGNSKYNLYYYDGGPGWKVGSDMRDKINVASIDNALSFISQVDPIKFRYNNRRFYSPNNSLLDYDEQDYKQGKKADSYFNYGVSAQQVSKILKDVYGSEYYGNIISKETEADFYKIEDCYTINLVNFIPFLIGAIKEQQQQIDELKNKLGDK